MLKRLFSSFFALVLATTGTLSLASPTANATEESIIIDNVLDLCTKVMSTGSWFDDSGTCDTYSKTQTSATLDHMIYVTGNWVLKNLDLTFVFSNSPFYIMSGSLTIDGGHYVSPSCVVWIQYRDGIYVPTTKVTINSGVFEATVETASSADSPSPVCLISREYLNISEAQAVIANYLPEGKKFIDVTPKAKTRTAETESTVNENIEAESGYVHISKEEKEREEAKYLKSTIVEVVDEPVSESGSEEPTKDDEPETTEEIVQETPFIPKAPDTGVAK